MICLRRWNSFSPNLGSRTAATVGGGYLIRAWDRKHNRYIGIAIDPGYNFLENLFNEGFTIPDIDLVVITHTHPDHIENLTNILTLIRERKRRIKEGKEFFNQIYLKDQRVLLAMTEGVFERFSGYFKKEEEYIRDVVVLSASNTRGNEAGKKKLNLWLDSNGDKTCHMELDCNEKKEGIISLYAAHAWHFDGTHYDSMGVVIEYKGDNDPCKVGIIGDTRYNSKLYDDYKCCDVLVAHLGSLVAEKMYKNSLARPDNDDARDDKKFKKQLLELIREKNHLYLTGLAFLICDLQKMKKEKDLPLLVLSEFGEELRGGLRKELTLRLSSILAHPDNDKEKGNNETSRLPIIPGDVGLRVDIEKKKVFCCICNCYKETENIKFETVMPDQESMAYVCIACYESRRGELTKLIEQWCTTARPVCKLEQKGND